MVIKLIGAGKDLKIKVAFKVYNKIIIGPEKLGTEQCFWILVTKTWC